MLFHGEKFTYKFLIGFSHGTFIGPAPQVSTDELYLALKQWLQLFPECQSSKLYVFGESYGAKFAIQLAKKIHDENAMLGPMS